MFVWIVTTWVHLAVPSAFAKARGGGDGSCCVVFGGLLLCPVLLLSFLRWYSGRRARDNPPPEPAWPKATSLLPPLTGETALVEAVRDAFLRLVRPDVPWPSSPFFERIDITGVTVTNAPPGTPSQVVIVASNLVGVQAEVDGLDVRVRVRLLYRYTHGQEGVSPPDWDDERLVEAELLWTLRLGADGRVQAVDDVVCVAQGKVRPRWSAGTRGGAAAMDALPRGRRSGVRWGPVRSIAFQAAGPSRLCEYTRVLSWDLGPQVGWLPPAPLPAPTLEASTFGRDAPSQPDHRLAPHLDTLSGLAPWFQTDAFLGMAKARCQALHVAWGEGDLEALGDGLSPRLAMLLRRWLIEDQAAGRVNHVDSVAVPDAEITAVVFDGDERTGFVSVTVRMWIAARDWTTSRDGQPYEGDPTGLQGFSEYWTFAQRFEEPEWTWTLLDIQQAAAYDVGLRWRP